MRLILSALATFTFLLGAAVADDYDKAASAYDQNDCSTALRLATPLADKGNGNAEVLLGNIYMGGTCAPQDYRAAARWYALASKQGNAVGQYDLAYMYYNPSSYGVRASVAEMVRLYLASARQGYAPAQNWIGAAYLQGDQGLPKDLVRAYMWLSLAMRTPDQGDRVMASGNRDTIALTAGQMGLADSLVRRCLQTRYVDCGDTYARSPHVAAVVRIPLKIDGGAFLVPVKINNEITLDFVLDSGASDVALPADVVSTLIRGGSVSSADFIGAQRYTLADGSTVPSLTFTIHSLRIGKFEAHNVTASVGPAQGPLLLGQSFLRKFGTWTIDNKKAELVLQ